MSTPKVRCPSCAAPVRAPSAPGRYRCPACGAALTWPIAADAPRATPRPAQAGQPDTRDGRPAPAARPATRGRPPARNGATVAVIAAAVFGGLMLVGIAGYFALKKSGPKEVVATDAPAAPVAPVEPARSAKGPEVKAVKKEEPKPPTSDEIVRRVKAATVYIRTTYAPDQVGMGSGFFVSKPGFVATNAHVIGFEAALARRPPKIEVVVASGEEDERALPATVYGMDPETDLALLRVTGPGLPAPLTFGRASELTETSDVVIYGYPFGELLGKNISVNRSTVSSLRKEKGKLLLVQLAGGVNPGNSGGPVTNTKGEVVGVSVAKLRGSEVGFAIPAEEADAFVNDLYRRGEPNAGAVAAGPAPRPPEPSAPSSPPENPAPTSPMPSKPTPGAQTPPPTQPPVPGPATPPAREPKKPVEPLPEKPVVAPPAKPPAKPPRPAVVLRKREPAYVPKNGPEEVRLPGRVTDVAVGGAGRFLIFRLAERQALAVFDACLGKIVKEVPLAEDTPHFAAGGNRLVVVYRGAKLVQYWNLNTFEKEKSALLPDALTSDNIHQICMGSATDGPLFVYLPKEKRTLAMDLATLKTTQVRWKHWAPDNAYGPLQMRVSADGAMLIGRGGGWAGCDVAFFDRGEQVGAFDKIPFWDAHNASALPSADGRYVFASGTVLNRALVATEWAGGKDAYAVPALEPGFVLTLHGAGKVGQQSPPNRAPAAVAVYNEDRQKLFFIKGLDEVVTDPLPWEKRIFYYPKSGTLITLGTGKDRLVLRRLDLTEELNRSGADYLAVTSCPPEAVAGKAFDYQIEARSKQGGVKFKLEAGPDGMKVSADGKVTWGAPTDLDKSVSVAVTVSDGSGQETIHSFELGTVAP